MPVLTLMVLLPFNDKIPELVRDINDRIDLINEYHLDAEETGLPVYMGVNGFTTQGALIQTAVVDSYTVVDSIQTVLVNTTGANRTVTLPAATQGRQVTVKKVRVDTSAFTVTVSAGSDKIDNQTNWILTMPGSALMMEADGTNWHVLSVVGGAS